MLHTKIQCHRAFILEISRLSSIDVTAFILLPYDKKWFSHNVADVAKCVYFHSNVDMERFLG